MLWHCLSINSAIVVKAASRVRLSSSWSSIRMTLPSWSTRGLGTCKIKSWGPQILVICARRGFSPEDTGQPILAMTAVNSQHRGLKGLRHIWISLWYWAVSVSAVIQRVRWTYRSVKFLDWQCYMWWKYFCLAILSWGNFYIQSPTCYMRSLSSSCWHAWECFIVSWSSPQEFTPNDWQFHTSVLKLYIAFNVYLSSALLLVVASCASWLLTRW